MTEPSLNITVDFAELTAYLATLSMLQGVTVDYATLQMKAHRMLAADALYDAAKELLRVDDSWRGSINSEMAHARNLVRVALALADGKE